MRQEELSSAGFVLLKGSKVTYPHSRLLVKLDTFVQVSLASHKCQCSYVMSAYVPCMCASGVSRVQ